MSGKQEESPKNGVINMTRILFLMIKF